MRTPALLAALFGLAVGLRLAVVHDLRDLPSTHALVEDAAAYDAMARELLAGGGLPETAFYQDPLYPYFLAASYATLGDSHLAVRVLQALMGGATAVLLALAAVRLGGGRPGAATAGLLAAGYGPLTLYAPQLLKETLLVLLESGFVFAALAALGAASAAWAAGAGLLLGWAALLRGNLLLVAPLAAAGLVVAAHRRGTAGRRRAWRPGIAFAAGIVLALLPVTLVNRQVSGEWILTTSQAGSNFYLGNRRGASGLYEPLRPGRQTPAAEREDARRVAAEVVARERGAAVAPGALSPAEVSRALWRESGREIVAAPGAWLGGLGRKFLYTWNRAENPDTAAFDSLRAESPWMAASPFTFAWVAPLGLAGLAALWRHRGARYLAVLVAGASISVALFYVFARYRLVLLPLLVPAAGAGVAELVASWRAGERRRPAVWAGTALATLGLVCWPAFDAADRAAWAALTQANEATAANRLGGEVAATDPGRALAWYAEAERRGRAALAADPDHLPARLALVVTGLRRGNLRLARGEREMASADYDDAERALGELLASPRAAAYPEMVENARRRLGRALAGGRAALAGGAQPPAGLVGNGEPP